MSEAATAVFIERLPAGGGGGLRVAVKDLIDVVGSVTTAGSPAVARLRGPARGDAAVITRLRESGARIIGKTNLHELAFGVSGVNPFYGTPENPADPGRVPGGSSSGSAVAVARGEADFALGSDTGGSIRIPAACCGVVGLKTTHGRVPLEGVFPLAPSFDTVGPMAASVAGVVAAMGQIEPGFAPHGDGLVPVRRAVLGGIEVEPEIDDAVTSALHAAELDVREVLLPHWGEGWRAQQVLLGDEALHADAWLLEATGGEGISAATLGRFTRARVVPAVLEDAREVASQFVPELVRLVRESPVLALPSIPCRPPLLEEAVLGFNVLTSPVNLAGLPAISVPVPVAGRPPTGLQLVAARGGEELLVSVAARIEEAVAV